MTDTVKEERAARVLTPEDFKALQEAYSDLEDGEGHFLRKQLEASEGLAALAADADNAGQMVTAEQMAAGLYVLAVAARQYVETAETFARLAWPWIGRGEVAIRALRSAEVAP
jgi:hypothetical protein